MKIEAGGTHKLKLCLYDLAFEFDMLVLHSLLEFPRGVSPR